MAALGGLFGWPPQPHPPQGTATDWASAAFLAFLFRFLRGRFGSGGDCVRDASTNTAKYVGEILNTIRHF